MPSIRQLPSGRFQARLWLSDGKSKSKTFDTREEAEQWAQDHRQERQATDERLRLASPPFEKNENDDRDKAAVRNLISTAIAVLRLAIERSSHAALQELVQASEAPAYISDVLRFYLHSNPNRYNRRFRYHATRSFDYLIAVVGDIPVGRLRRSDARTFIERLAKAGLRTSSIRRVLNQITAAMSLYFTEHEIDRSNPFRKVRIPNEGEDTKQREPFTPAELRILLSLCQAADDDIRWIVALLADTGARLAEVAGLALDDIVLDANVPHIAIRHRDWRSVKGGAKGNSPRDVPLVGFALWAAKRVKESAQSEQRFAFPRYTSALKCNANAASAAIGKWMRDSGLNHSAHELRHTMADRLREARCPDEIIKAIGGWSAVGQAASYGRGHSLSVTQEWLDKAACPYAPY